MEFWRSLICVFTIVDVMLSEPRMQLCLFSQSLAGWRSIESKSGCSVTSCLESALDWSLSCKVNVNSKLMSKHLIDRWRSDFWSWCVRKLHQSTLVGMFVLEGKHVTWRFLIYQKCHHSTVVSVIVWIHGYLQKQVRVIIQDESFWLFIVLKYVFHS